jgi:acetylornithine deacetylase/succinyl-diaminopimelate desuccinylase-like protein
MPDIRTFIEANRERFMEEYFALLRIHSISPGNLHPDECRHAAELILGYLNNAGCANTRLIETEHNPLVYGEILISESLPTILVYGHYDVMPAEIEDGWDTDPFEPFIRDGKVYARGAEDNKGQLFIVLKTLEYLGLNKSLNCNIKCIIEGEEEIGSPGLREFLSKDSGILKADIAVICDTDMLNEQTPAIVISTRESTEGR